MEKRKSYVSMFPPNDIMQLISAQTFISNAILIAYEIGLFKKISAIPLSIEDLAKELHLNPRPVQALVSCSSTLGLVKHTKQGYLLTALGKLYFDEKNPEYYGKVFDLYIQENSLLSFQKIKEAILSDIPQVNEQNNLFSDQSVGSSKIFVEALHQKAFVPAFHWPKNINLQGNKTFVDIGGGSGIHTIAACLKNPSLKGIICDRSSIIEHSQKYIKDFKLENRIKTLQLNIWKDDFPKGDVFFLGDIFHDWKKDKCIFLAKKCFESIPQKGKIILHEMLFNEEKTGPLLTSAYNIKMMVWTEGQQFSKSEITEILQIAGFKNITIKKSKGNWSVIIGYKNN